MTYLRDQDWQSYLKDVKDGTVAGAYIINKFGRNASVPNGTMEPVCIGGVWQTPVALTTLELVTTSANDTATGTGARKVRVWGIGVGSAEFTEDVIPNGLTPVALTRSFSRITRMQVIEAGSYAIASALSHTGTITLQGVLVGEIWAVIDTATTGMGVGQSQIGETTIPAGYVGTLLSKRISVDSTKTAKVYFFTREGIDIVTAPFSVMNLKEQEDGITGFMCISPDAPLLTIPEKTDCGFMALGDGAVCSVSVDFQILVEAM